MRRLWYFWGRQKTEWNYDYFAIVLKRRLDQCHQPYRSISFQLMKGQRLAYGKIDSKFSLNFKLIPFSTFNFRPEAMNLLIDLAHKNRKQSCDSYSTESSVQSRNASPRRLIRNNNKNIYSDNDTNSNNENGKTMLNSKCQKLRWPLNAVEWNDYIIRHFIIGQCDIHASEKYQATVAFDTYHVKNVVE